MKNRNKSEWAWLVNSFDSIEAGMIEAILSGEGIPVLKKSKGAGAYTEIFMGRPASGWDIYVPEIELARSRELIAAGIKPVEPEVNFSGPENEVAGPALLEIMRPAAKKIIVLIVILPMIIGFLWYLLIELPRMIKSIF